MTLALQSAAPLRLPVPTELALGDFVSTFGESLLGAVREQNPPIYNGEAHPARERVMSGLLRQPFPAQRDVVQAVAALLCEANDPSAIVNAEMGTGKTIMAIAAAANMGFNSMPKKGYNIPAAMGMPMLL